MEKHPGFFEGQLPIARRASLDQLMLEDKDGRHVLDLACLRIADLGWIYVMSALNQIFIQEPALYKAYGIACCEFWQELHAAFKAGL